ncbi:DsbA family protein [Candidatus Woesearchaeota archaeon]|jgi:protein-disulfide isomerase|nr:DsbA family protein [Candidatus Woesearchaeota archaeon]MBT3538337.1 DsbA family protein [Candidatus Woesearchaeota archaeon]MBT4698314.1 DsbA family protein [Candidatus Woesearchaeota archaeon]MBT4716787.1 DsbA family protein [Candidatus Woesearchaeota archaeon]MBT7106006.1 DsbA family protein [Candidatus Woesearchaeota archaeon]
MKVKKRTLHLSFGVVVLILFFFFVLKFISQSDYPDVETPKAYLGNSDAAVQLVEFSDMQCPFCAKAHDVIHDLAEQYGDRIGIAFHHFPLSYHDHARDLAQAAECANDQGKFWEYIDVAFELQDSMNSKKVSEIAEWVELDVPLFKECMRSELKDKFVQADYDLGIDMGVGGTPSLFINGEVFDDWEYDAITAKIDSLLAE